MGRDRAQSLHADDSPTRHRAPRLRPGRPDACARSCAGLDPRFNASRTIAPASSSARYPRMEIEEADFVNYGFLPRETSACFIRANRRSLGTRECTRARGTCWLSCAGTVSPAGTCNRISETAGGVSPEHNPRVCVSFLKAWTLRRSEPPVSPVFVLVSSLPAPFALIYIPEGLRRGRPGGDRRAAPDLRGPGSRRDRGIPRQRDPLHLSSAGPLSPVQADERVACAGHAGPDPALVSDLPFQQREPDRRAEPRRRGRERVGRSARGSRRAPARCARLSRAAAPSPGAHGGESSGASGCSRSGSA